ncbi:MAG: type II toxin-antitoxin system RelE/ParE family toxin [Deltaproteobacteria bacterium]|nr:type II toxin-antitoxin system RelE/ParE family toxin [Deltaproteobacteria bacterium]
MKIRLTRLAEQDLESIETYLGEENPRDAVRCVLRILEALEGLMAFPNLGRPGRVPGTRELVVSGLPFIAAYRVQANEIWILRVLHAARRWPPSMEP